LTETKGIWEKIFRDTLFEGGKIPTLKQRKKMYDLCYRKVRRESRKEGRKPSKEEMNEQIEDCLRNKLYAFQLEPEPEKPRKNVDTFFDPAKMNRQKEEREFAEDARRLNRLNRDFWDSGEDREEERKKENKRLKDWIESKVRSESGG